MKILFISDKFPTPDRNSGELRFYSILKILSLHHEVFFHSYFTYGQMQAIGREETERYEESVRSIGVTVLAEHIKQISQLRRFDCVFFELYTTARRHLDKVRYWQPHARIIVDTVDVHFKRLLSQAQLTGKQEDFKKARRMRRSELSAYNKADVVIAVTEDDRQALLAENKRLQVEVIPNIHEIEPLQEIEDIRPSLVFVGGFNHDPNVDGVLYFHHEILSLIKARVPEVTLDIVGYSPPQEVLALASPGINVTGFVPDTKPYLLANRISIAPLRFGAGMKGKIGEAMAHGLPVVTTSIGSEGFGLIHGENVMVADTPEDFAESVVRLFEDKALYDKIRKNGWSFICERYSYQIVGVKIKDIFDGITKFPVKGMKFHRFMMIGASIFYEKHLKQHIRSFKGQFKHNKSSF